MKRLLVVFLLAASLQNAEDVLSNSYDFTPQFPSGILTGGSTATVTLTPVPLGVNATDVKHSLYIPICSGGAQYVFITGGTAVSGSSYGTVTFKPTNSCTAGWSIRSATSGIREGVSIAGPAGSVRIPGGNVDLYGPIYVPDGYSTSVRGQGMLVTTLLTHFTDTDAFVYDYASLAGFVDTGDFAIYDAIAANHTAGVMVRIRYRPYGLVSNIWAQNCYDCYWMERNNNAHYQNTDGLASHITFKVTCNGVPYPACQNEGSISGGHLISDGAGSTSLWIDAPITGLTISNIFTEQGTVSGSASLRINQLGTNPLNELQIQNSILDGHNTGVLFSGGTVCETNSLKLTGNRITAADYGIFLQGAAEGGVCNVEIQDNTINAKETQAGDAAILLDNTANVSILNNPKIAGGPVAGYGILTQNANHDTVLGGNYISGFSAALAGPAITNLTRYNNVGIDNVQPAVASAALIILPINPNVTITGTTGVGTVLSTLTAGSHGTLITPDGAVVFTAGASIGSTCTTTQNSLYLWSWDGAKFWMSGKGC